MAYAAAAAGMLSDAIKTGVGMAFSAKEAKKQRRFAKHMYRHAVQYRMEDLRKAGINPILAGQMVGGVPSGSAASMPSAGSGGPQSALAAVRLSEELKNMKAERVLKEEQGRLAKEHWNESRTRQWLHNAQAEREKATTRATTINRMLTETQLPAAQAQARFDATDFGQFLREARRFVDTIPAVGLLGVGAAGGGAAMSARRRRREKQLQKKIRDQQRKRKPKGARNATWQ